MRPVCHFMHIGAKWCLKTIGEVLGRADNTFSTLWRVCKIICASDFPRVFWVMSFAFTCSTAFLLAIMDAPLCRLFAIKYAYIPYKYIAAFESRLKSLLIAAQRFAIPRSARPFSRLFFNLILLHLFIYFSIRVQNKLTPKFHHLRSGASSQKCRWPIG